ncbi:MAG: extracellular solute-binding protein [Firmicutes bacterium]|nr:extracellular solute-binding protein [Bacillota bacterium]
MKKLFTLICLLLSVVLMSSCGVVVNPPNPDDNGQEITEITLWTFPVGNWGNTTSVSNILTRFHRAYPNIHITVEFLDYNTGDEKINNAAKNNKLPDLVLEGPERLVANWGVNGMMADLSDLWQSETAQTVDANVNSACKAADGKYYEVPICMTAHCMAINYDMFEEADALQFLDKDAEGNFTHTWTTENFVKAVKKIAEKYGTAAEVYCKNQSGDQGTRALVTNLYGGSFTDSAHTEYTVDSKDNIKALELLVSLDGIKFNSEAASGDAISNFCKKETAMCFCWSAALAVQQIINNPNMDFNVMPMAFPTEEGAPKLQGGIWGFGVFDNGNDARIDAAKTFIKYITENDDVYSKAVTVSSYWPVRKIVNGSAEIDIYENDDFMYEYGTIMKYMGDYYQIMPNWQDARDAWWAMLAKIGNGEDVSDAIEDFPKKEK